MSREEKEISVKLPYAPYIEEPEIIKNTIEEERVHVFGLAKRIGESISGLMIMIGALLSIASIQFLFPNILKIPGLPDVRSLLTPELILIIAGIIGLINIICGFVLLAKK